MIPIRCFSCGSLIGDKWEEFVRKIREGEQPQSILNNMGIKRYCCRRMLVSNVDVIDEFLKYTEVTGRKISQTEYGER